MILAFQPKQRRLNELIDGTCSWIGYGGSRGGGKSGALRRIMLKRRIENPGTWGVIFRRVFEDLRLNHIDEFWKEYPELRQFYQVQDHAINLPNKSKIIFMTGETQDDIKRKFHGPGFMDIFVDQAEQMNDSELRQMKTANRWTGLPDYKCKFVLFFNPGGQGLGFLKRIFHDKKYEGRENPQDYAFIQAYGWDNIFWVIEALKMDYPTLKTDVELAKVYYDDWSDEQRFNYFITRSEYGRDLDSKPPGERLGQLLGSFDKFAGQYFTAAYEYDKNVIDESQTWQLIKPWWNRWIAIDWGFKHHTSVQWCARGVVTKEELRKVTGLISETNMEVGITYRSLLMQETSEWEMGESIASKCDDNEKRAIKYVFLSPDAFAKKTTANTIAQQLGESLRYHGLPQPAMADNDRVGGWRLCYGELKEAYELNKAA